MSDGVIISKLNNQIKVLNLELEKNKKYTQNLEKSLLQLKSENKDMNTALDEANAKFVTAGLVADINSQTEIDAEYAYKLKLEANTKETTALYFYILYKAKR